MPTSTIIVNESPEAPVTLIGVVAQSSVVLVTESAVTTSTLVTEGGLVGPAGPKGDPGIDGTIASSRPARTDVVSPLLIYQGFGPIAANDVSPVFQIRRIVRNGLDTVVSWSAGLNAWADRLTLNYV
jgi:hypothetical protein